MEIIYIFLSFCYNCFIFEHFIIFIIQISHRTEELNMQTDRKIKILGIAPYEGMKNILQKVGAEHPEVDLDVFLGDLMEGVHIFQKHASKNYDVIISRGGTADLIRQITDIPVVDVTVSVYDILRSIKLAENYEDKYAIVGFPAIAKSAHILCDLLKYTVDIFTVHNKTEARDTMNRLKQEGYRMVLCDMVGSTIARELELNCILITSGQEQVAETLKLAIRQAISIRHLANENTFLKSALSAQTGDTVIIDGNSDVYFSTVDLAGSPDLFDAVCSEVSSVLASETHKFFKNIGGTLYSFVCRSSEFENKQYAIFCFQTANVPLATDKYGIQYTNVQETGDQFFNSFYSVTSSVGNFHETISNLALSEAPIMLSGEAGSGKERVAKIIYSQSPLKANPLIMINCALATDKVWNFLSNHYNSPLNDNNNTLFFEDITALGESRLRQLQSLILDTKLAKRNRLIFTCVCAAGQQMPESAIRFVNQLSCVTVHLAPLRMRTEKIPSLASLYLNLLNTSTINQAIGFDDEAMRLLQNFSWPYNYTQFKRILTELAMMTDTPYIKAGHVAAVLQKEMQLVGGNEDIPSEFVNTGFRLDLGKSLADINSDIVELVLASCGGNQSLAAKQLGISRTTLWRYISK